MKAAVLSVIVCLAGALSGQAQIRPYIPGLGYDTLAGDFLVFHPREHVDHARRVQQTMSGFTELMRDSLGFDRQIDVLLLTYEDYSKIPPWYPPGTAFPTDDGVFVMETPPEKAFITGRWEQALALASGSLGDSLEIVGRRVGIPRDSIAYWLYADLVPMHEFAHIANVDFLGGHPGGPAPNHHHTWLNEMAAEFDVFAAISLLSPELRDLYVAARRAFLGTMDVPPGSRSGLDQLRQCDAAYARVWEEWSMGWCWSWWSLRGAEVFDERGFQFLRDLDDLVPWPDRSHPYPTVEEMLTALNLVDPGWMVWVEMEDDAPSLPSGARLNQNYPNPFNPDRVGTTIPYSIETSGKVTLTIHDLLGRPVMTLVDAVQAPGRYELDFSGTTLPAGLYRYRLESAGSAETRSMILLR